MAIKSVQFVYPDGSPFALVHEAQSAFSLWDAREWAFLVNGVKYNRDDWRGRCAIETLFGVSYQIKP